MHAKPKKRARDAGMSLSDYVAQQLAELVTYRSNAEIFEDARRRAHGGGQPTADEIVRGIHEARADRDESLFDGDGVFGPDGILGDTRPDRRR